MGLYSDISALVGDGYPTKHILDGGAEIPINLATGRIASLADVRDLLPSPLDIGEVDIELIGGTFASCYGIESELTFVLLLDSGGEDYWAHCFEYEDLSGYTDGVALQTPSLEVRV